MFGVSTIGADGVRYDSKSEAAVASALYDLQMEQVISGYVAHPVVFGLTFDFLVQIGPKGSSKLDGSTESGELVLLEYDGLQESRMHDLSPKLARHVGILAVGIDVRWLLSSDHESVRKCMLHYTPPQFIQKEMTCACGAFERITVTTSDPDHFSKPTISRAYVCAACGRATRAK